jgi:hypothetical protein
MFYRVGGVVAVVLVVGCGGQPPIRSLDGGSDGGPIEPVDSGSRDLGNPLLGAVPCCDGRGPVRCCDPFGNSLTGRGVVASCPGADGAAQGTDWFSRCPDPEECQYESLPMVWQRDRVECVLSMPPDGGTAPDDAGVDGGADVGCAAGCGVGGDCVEGDCHCRVGYIDDGPGCSPLPSGAPELRRMDEVREGWRAGRTEEETGVPWSEPAEICDPGTLSPTTIDDGIRRVNLYRWLTGLDTVDESPGDRLAAQSCALMHLRQDSIATPDASWACHTAEASRGSASSVVSRTSNSVAGHIGTLMLSDDTGPRRVLLSPLVDTMTFGRAGEYQCSMAAGTEGVASRPWVAYPNPGFTCTLAGLGPWSFFADFSLAGATVELYEGGWPIDVEDLRHEPRYFGQEALFWSLGSLGLTSQPYEVVIRGTGVGTIRYELEFLLDC